MSQQIQTIKGRTQNTKKKTSQQVKKLKIDRNEHKLIS